MHNNYFVRGLFFCVINVKKNLKKKKKKEKKDIHFDIFVRLLFSKNINQQNAIYFKKKIGKATNTLVCHQLNFSLILDD